MRRPPGCLEYIQGPLLTWSCTLQVIINVLVSCNAVIFRPVYTDVTIIKLWSKS